MVRAQDHPANLKCDRHADAWRSAMTSVNLVLLDTEYCSAMFDATLTLPGWLLAVTVLGWITNLALVGCLFRNTKCRGSGIAVGVLACFVVHLPLTWVLIEFVIQIWCVPFQEVETVGYYVGPGVFAFVSLPAGAIACR